MRFLGLLVLAAVGRHHDAYWGIEYKLEGLQPLLNLGEPTRIYLGKTKDLRVEMVVHESVAPKNAPQWRDELHAALQAAKGCRGFVRAGARLRYERITLAGFRELHGHAFFVRGHQCIELHLKADTDVDLDRAMAGFKLAPEAPGTMLAYRIGKEKGLPPDHPEVLLEAGIEYVTGRVFRLAIPALAQRVFLRARKLMKPGSYKPRQLWTLYENGGLAFAAEPEKALAWHTLAEQAAARLDPALVRQSAYNVACMSSRLGRVDDAFAALYRAYADGKPVSDAHVSADKDLEACRKDKRWDTFWREKVKGQ